MRLAIWLLFVAGLHAQVLVSLTAPGSVSHGKNITLTITAVSPTNAPDTGVAGFQWTLAYPPGGYTAVAAVSPAAATVGKTLTCTADNTSCVLVGLTNATTIPAGVIATYTMHVPKSAAPGTVRVGLSGLVATDGSGNPVPVQVGTSFTVR